MKVSFAIALAAAIAAGDAAAACHDIVAGDGKVSFRITQDGAPFQGRFRSFGGRLCEQDGVVESIDAWLDPASVDTGLPELDDALESEAFFDVARFSRVTFRSSSIDDIGEHHVAHGKLEIKGIERNIDVPFDMRAKGGGLRIEGKVNIRRLDFDVGTGEWSNTDWLGGIVTVQFSVSLQ